ncbi:MAG TPA: NAD(P)/FAD-dependent oxidoreductase [Tahibacter sp.]|uniref:NAD(P)/FAD-dependent oxidoreductase n=1 Tax=Tahibacter sp. TaxID=2056211 RepID=UPI002CEDEAC4|nr:NAD(P)/FAD-dependent oxidoreductase [Tahibacter sp.]HSX63009.1 NAD(P)/FAD-dependent oxidoreductase [Tahibacter sp.]
MNRFDALVVGGGFAGLAAALLLARTRRRVAVLDAGLPRNRFAAHSHGVLAQDGRSGGAILADARTQLAAYPNATLIAGTAQAAAGNDGDFVVTTADGRDVAARKLLLAVGVSDTLPGLPGLAERWGSSVVHCPYCHGYEIGGGPIAVLAGSVHAAQHAALIADWGEVTLLMNGQPEPDGEDRDLLRRRGVRVETAPVASLAGPGTTLDAIVLQDGRRLAARALFVATRTHPAGPIAQQLGCAIEETPLGAILRTDERRQTSVPGVHAAGDAALARSNITLAAADGVTAGFGLHQSLIADDIARAA